MYVYLKNKITLNVYKIIDIDTIQLNQTQDKSPVSDSTYGYLITYYYNIMFITIA